MKTALKLFLLVAICGYLVFALTKLARPAEELTCKAIDISISDSLSPVRFVTEEYVYGILSQNKVYAEGQKLSNIHLDEIEQILTEDPYIRTASCYCTASSHLSIDITPEQPVLHVMTDKEDYYLDVQGSIMPIGDFNIDLCIATGNISKQFATDYLIGLASYIHESELWDSQIEQIHVNDSAHVELFPRVGGQTIMLGTVDDYERKLRNLEAFYKKGLSLVGWNKYTQIDLSYRDQVICKKKETSKH